MTNRPQILYKILSKFDTCSKHAARTETMEKKYVLNLNYHKSPRVANSGQYTAADDGEENHLRPVKPHRPT
ncbi:hypothetical protein OUZ56_003629 [Daphnia magna]|uniref:Uncharacterized protein n=1 Tax=Daphnia magna TaxID=35525 RepID=A0ABR0A9B4_9CRUS|nr:hypothetical protein OUZ56_003629 [Daphnia magna]